MRLIRKFIRLIVHEIALHNFKKGNVVPHESSKTQYLSPFDIDNVQHRIVYNSVTLFFKLLIFSELFVVNYCRNQLKLPHIIQLIDGVLIGM